MAHFGMNHIGARCRNGAVGILSRIPSGHRTMTLTPAAGFDITLKNLTCENTLRNLSIKIEEREVVLLESDSESKTSLLFAVIMRLVPFESGTVEIGGVSLSNHQLFSLRRNVRWVSADLPLVRGTVAHNICSASQHVSADDLRSIVKICGLKPSKNGLPHGLETSIVNGGTNLPAGARARVALARALATVPRVVLIDDPVFLNDLEARCALERVIATDRYTILIAGSSGQRLAGVDRVFRLGD